MYATAASAIIISFCVPLLAYWSVEMYRLVSEQKANTDGGSQAKPNLPLILMSIGA
jgi:hypothetical protein